MNRDTIDAIVREAVEAAPSPSSFAEMSAKDREHHDLVRQRRGLSEAEYLAAMVTAEDLTEAADLDEIARAARGGGRR